MIAKLRGTVDSVGEDWAVVDVGGVGYLVSCSTRTLGKLAVGEAATLAVETHVREDAIQLYGFGDKAEREWFRLLTTVQGVGAKVGLALLSALSVDDISQAIVAGDKAMITRANGVGPKLAARLISELKDKVGGMALASAGDTLPGNAGTGGSAPVSVEAGAVGDAVSALVNLGYRRVEAYAAVVTAVRSLGESAAASALIRAALRDLGQRELRA